MRDDVDMRGFWGRLQLCLGPGWGCSCRMTPRAPSKYTLGSQSRERFRAWGGERGVKSAPRKGRFEGDCYHCEMPYRAR